MDRVIKVIQNIFLKTGENNFSYDIWIFFVRNFIKRPREIRIFQNRSGKKSFPPKTFSNPAHEQTSNSNSDFAPLSSASGESFLSITRLFNSKKNRLTTENLEACLLIHQTQEFDWYDFEMGKKKIWVLEGKSEFYFFFIRKPFSINLKRLEIINLRVF